MKYWINISLATIARYATLAQFRMLGESGSSFSATCISTTACCNSRCRPEQSETQMRYRGARVDLQSTLELRFLPSEVSVQNPFGVSEVAMRLSIFLVERNRLQRCCF